MFSQTNNDTKSFGQKILNGSAKPCDDKITFQTLDSLFCKNPIDKDFYFKVANKIQNLSDGALSEFFSGIASKYYLQYNLEFIKNSEKVTSEEIKGWLSQADYDIAATKQRVDSLPMIKKQLSELITNCNCSDKHKKLIVKYNKSLYSIIEEGIRNP